MSHYNACKPSSHISESQSRVFSGLSKKKDKVQNLGDQVTVGHIAISIRYVKILLTKNSHTMSLSKPPTLSSCITDKHCLFPQTNFPHPECSVDMGEQGKLSPSAAVLLSSIINLSQIEKSLSFHRFACLNF